MGGFYQRAPFGDTRSDQVRWADQGKPETTTLDERAALIADANTALRRGGTKWVQVYDRALAQLREVEQEARRVVVRPDTSANREFGDG